MQSPLAQFITERQKALGLLNREVSQAVGFPRQNFYSMVRSGKSRLPLEHVPALADALKVDRAKLMLMALEEYRPEILTALNDSLFPTLTTSETLLIQIWRRAVGDLDPEIDSEEATKLFRHFTEYAHSD